MQDSHTAHRLPGLPAIAVFSGRTANKLPVRISALIARIIVAHIVKEAKRSPSQHRSDSGRPLTAEMKPGIEASDEGIRFLHFWGKHFEVYNGLGNRCLLIGLSEKYGKHDFRPSETMSVNTCAFARSRY